MQRLFVLLALLAGAVAVPASSADLFAPASMTEVHLDGLRVRLGQPVQVTESHGYAYIPVIARFPSGELLVAYSQVADTNQNPAYHGAFQISRDGGQTWGQRYEVLPEHQPLIYVPQSDGSLLGVPSQLYPASPAPRIGREP